MRRARSRSRLDGSQAVDWSEYGGAGSAAASRELPPAPLAYALLLAFSSSTDNFLVGLYVGLSKSAVFRLNAVLALSNAAAASAAASVGKAIGRTVPTVANWLAAALYGFLAFDEVRRGAPARTARGSQNPSCRGGSCCRRF